jgi:hypothetical protein
MAKKLKCFVCKKLISGRGKSNLCQSCIKKKLYKNPQNNPMFRKHHTEKTKSKIAKANFKNGKPHCINCRKEIGYEHKRCPSCYHKFRIGFKHSKQSKKLLS